MADEMVIDGTAYVSSKRAAETTGYAQDYIGQLARSGQIDARRVGGLWFINVASIERHKNLEALEGSEGEPASRAVNHDPDSFVGLDGKSYISAHRASKLSGYNQDYVGQLARSGQIVSRQVGNRWYVDQESLDQHKAQKEALLAAVQRDAVGLATGGQKTVSASELPSHDDSFLSYFEDKGELLPTIHESREAEKSSLSDFSSTREGKNDSVDTAGGASEVTTIAIRRHYSPPQAARSHPDRPARYSSGRLPALRASRLPMILVSTAATLTVVLVVAAGSSLVQNDSVYAVSGRQVGAVAETVEHVLAAIESLLTKEVVYVRNQ